MTTAVAVRKEYARRSHEASEEWKQRMQRAEMTLEENDQTYKAVGAGILIHTFYIVKVSVVYQLLFSDLQLRPMCGFTN